MDMKGHILLALREEFDEWEALLASLSTDQLATPLLPSEWTVKDVMVHLWAWQQRSIARVQAALEGHEPVFQRWHLQLDVDSAENTDQVNDWIYQANRSRSWAEVHQMWRDGFLSYLELGGKVMEVDLLDSERYPWMKGYPLVTSQLSSYDHHKEHLDKLQAWLAER